MDYVGIALIPFFIAACFVIYLLIKERAESNTAHENEVKQLKEENEKLRQGSEKIVHPLPTEKFDQEIRFLTEIIDAWNTYRPGQKINFPFISDLVTARLEATRDDQNRR